MKKTKEEIISYRLHKSDDDLKNAQLLATNQSWDGTVNRLYYATDHAVSALMMQEGVRITSHSGAKAMFELHFIKSGNVDVQWSKFYSRIFKSRNDCDYEDFTIFTAEDVFPLLTETERFIAVIKNMINH